MPQTRFLSMNPYPSCFGYNLEWQCVLDGHRQVLKHVVWAWNEVFLLIRQYSMILFSPTTFYSFIGKMVKEVFMCYVRYGVGTCTYRFRMIDKATNNRYYPGITPQPVIYPCNKTDDYWIDWDPHQLTFNLSAPTPYLLSRGKW